MRQQKIPRTVMVDHLCCSGPRKVGLFKRTIVCDYESPEGIVREYHKRGRPGYKLLKTGERVNVNFSSTYLEDLNGFYDIDCFSNYGLGRT